MSRAERGPTDTGVPVFPKLPVPKGRDSESKMGKNNRQLDKTLVAMFGGAIVLGLILGYVVRPCVSKDPRVAELEDKVVEVDKAAGTQKQRADGLEKDLDVMRTTKASVEKKLTEAQKAQTELQSRTADAEKDAKDRADAQKKLQAAVDKATGTISADGNEIRLQLVDKILFKLNDDQLTDPGKKVLDKVAVALKELPDKQIWVQGHTDDTPIFNPAPPKQPPLKKGQKPPPPPPPPKFATNWELSAYRALSVVHYLQDVGKIEPTRLAALAFGQYHPLRGASKAANRRIEIVLYPKPALRK